MSWTHCAWASKQTTGSAINKLVLMMMADATSHDNPLLILRIKTLSEKCESSESSVKRSIKDLESLGLLICVERFFENTQQSNAYILVTNEINPSDAEKIAKENERSGCFFKIRGGGGVHSEPRVGSEGTQGGFTVTPRATPSYSLPSFKEPIATLAPLTRMSPEEQQPENEAASSTGTITSQTLAQTPDQPLSSRATPPPPSSAGPLPLVAETIYSHYPRKIGKADALKAISKAIKQDGYQAILDATMEYARAVARWPDSEKQYVPHPSTWFNRASYLDDRSEWMKKCKRLPQSQSTKRFLSPAEMQAQDEEAARNYVPGFRL